MTTPQFALGAMSFGTTVDRDTSMALLDRFAARGGRWIDTANCYSFWADPSGVGGQSETLIGEWLTARDGVRDRILISTKVGQQPTAAGKWPESAEGLSPAVIHAAVRDSLRRLRTDRIDLYWAHAEKRDDPLAETVAAFGATVRDGLVRRLGASNHTAWRVERARALAREQGVTGWTALQLRHSYVHPRPWAVVPEGGHRLATAETLDYAASEDDVDLWVYSSLLSGAYTRADRPMHEIYDHPGTTRRLAVLAEVSAETGATPHQVVLAWLTGGTPGIVPIVGVSREDQLDEAFEAMELRLTEDQRRRMDQPV
ncbi:aldo/keto reductase [Streptomyces tsukubensis]|uniref:Oxidoreductase n=1 Tax=Streptomyces tsukubensis TaxID=83656 RepID=A0A1V4AFH5_9ACTN|nr:aldo/keto reductase [Streptomyces tsukubensis]OON82632.1 oxidoreductase [Streptomyces tsukubensis]QFR92196.1 aldo/keto reductase [Streptomyces tsukubensis]